MPPTCKEMRKSYLSLYSDQISVCPYCCNCLTIARAPGTDDHPQGLNAFTCRTCPYQFVLDQPYYERTYMKKKEKGDIMGEEQSDLPINEGTDPLVSSAFISYHSQYPVDARMKSVLLKWHTSINYRRGVQMNLLLLFSR